MLLDGRGIQPPGPDGTSSSSSQGFASEPKQLGLPYTSSSLQPGEAFYTEKVYDHGNYDSETKEASSVQYIPVQTPTQFPIGNLLRLGPFVDGFWFGHPYIDRMLLTRRYPPGTYALSSSTLEHGRNHWHDTFNIKDIPSSTWQSDTKSIKRSNQPVQQSSAGYDLGEPSG